MSKIEIEADVPDGWVGVEYLPPKKGEWYLRHDGPCLADFNYEEPWLILRRVEPKRESRWCAIPEDTFGVCYVTREAAAAAVVQVGRRLVIERRDYEDGKLVSVTLEPTP